MSSDKSTTLPEPSPVEFGGRVELRLAEGGDNSDGLTRYTARWFTADQKLEGEVTIATGAQVSVHAPATLPEWLGSFTTTLVRTTARQAQKENTWPRRLTRWRKSPLGAGTVDDESE